MSDIICTVTREFANALDRVSAGVDLSRVAVFRIQNGGLIYYRLSIGRGDKGATDLLADEIALDIHAKRAIAPDIWDGIAERLIARLALVERGIDFSYSERAWKAETEGRFTPNTPLPPTVHTVIIAPDVRFEVVTPIMETRDVRIVLLGPRDPCRVTNEKTGHAFIYDAPIGDAEVLEVDMRERRVTIKPVHPSINGSDPRPALDHFVRPDRELMNPNYAHLFAEWFALVEGTQTIRIDPLVTTLAGVLTEGKIR